VVVPVFFKSSGAITTPQNQGKCKLESYKLYIKLAQILVSSNH